MNIRINRERCFYTHAIRHLYPYQIHNKQRGALLIGLIVTMIIFSILGGSMVYLLSSSTFDPVFGNFAQRAYYAAESGMRFATAVYRNDPTNGLDNFFALDNSELTFPNNGKARLSIARTTGSNFTATTTTNLEQGGNLNISCPNNDCNTSCTNNVCSGGFPERNGFFTISGISGYFRYKIRSGNILQTVTGPLDLPADTTITSPANQVSITSKGYFPISSIFDVSRTVEYGWILSGSPSGAPPSDPMNDTSNWNATAGGQSWGSVGIGQVDNNNALGILNTASSAPTRVLVGYSGTVNGIQYFQNLWNNNNKFLSYDVQVKMDAYHTMLVQKNGNVYSFVDDLNRYYLKYFMGGILFRVDSTGSNYNAFGVGLARSLKANKDIPDVLIPTDNDIYLVLYREESTGQQKTLLAWKKLAENVANTTNSGIEVVNKFINAMTDFSKWTPDKSGEGILPLIDSGAIKLSINNSSNTTSDSFVTATTPFQSVTTNTRGGYSTISLKYKTDETFNKVDAYIETSYDGTSWNNSGIVISKNMSWQNISSAALPYPPPTGSSGPLQIRIRLTGSNKQSRGDLWVKPVDSSNVIVTNSNLTDWPTILVRIRESMGNIGSQTNVKVNDIKIYYTTQSTVGEPNATPIDPDGNDYNRAGSVRGGIQDPTDPTKKTLPWPAENIADTTEDNDYFTIVQWDDWLKTVPNSFAYYNGATDLYIRTTYNTSPTTTWDPLDRPEVGLFAYGSESTGGIWFDDFGIQPPGGGGGVPYVVPIQQ